MPYIGRRTRHCAYCVLALALTSATFLLVVVRGQATTGYGAEVAQLASVDRSALNNFMGLAPNDPRSYANGVWTNPGTNCWWCLDSAATAAAVLSRQTIPADPALVRVAIATFNDAINNHQMADGSWDENAINTGFFAVELGTSYLELHDVLDATTQGVWANAMRRAANYLINQHDLTWYINGNVNLRQAAVMWMTWKITGDPQYQTDFQSEWNFTMNPPQTRWPGFGLHLTTVPTRPDDSDGAGYLGESGAGAPGFDPEYTMTQLDGATSMWVLSHDPRWLQLMNLFFNQLRPRISSSFILDATGGTRESVVIPFYSGGLAVLYDSGDRPDLAGLISGDLASLEAQFSNTGNYTSANLYRGLSGWVSMIVLDYQHPQGLVTALTTAATTPVSTTPSTTVSTAATTTPTAPANPSVLGAASRLTVDVLPTLTHVRRGWRLTVQVTAANAEADRTVDVQLVNAHPPARVLARAVRVAGRNGLVRVRLRAPGTLRGRRVRGLYVRVTMRSRGQIERVIVRTLTLR